MILDKFLIFEENQTIPSASTVDAASHLDFEVAKTVGNGNVWFNALVTVDGAGGTSCQVILYDSADDSAFSERITSFAVELADLVKGAVILSVPLAANLDRYLKAALVGAGSFSAGKVSTFLSLSPILV